MQNIKTNKQTKASIGQGPRRRSWSEAGSAFSIRDNGRNHPGDTDVRLTLMSDFQPPEWWEYISVIVSHSICRNLSWQPWGWMYMDAHSAPPTGVGWRWPGCSQLSALRGDGMQSGSLMRESWTPTGWGCGAGSLYPWGEPRLQTMMKGLWDLVVTQHHTTLSGSTDTTPGVQKTRCHNTGNQPPSNMHK